MLLKVGLAHKSTKQRDVKNKIIRSWKENEVVGFVVFSQKLLIGYFRLGKC